MRMRLHRRGRIPGALSTSLEETTREAAVAQWLRNRSKWRRPLPPFPTSRGDLARAVALICFIAAAGMALAFFGSYLAVHEIMDGYDTRAAIGAVGLGVLFGGSGVWLITLAERKTRHLLSVARRS